MVGQSWVKDGGGLLAACSGPAQALSSHEREQLNLGKSSAGSNITS